MRPVQPLPRLPEANAERLRRYVTEKDRQERGRWDAEALYAKDRNGNERVVIGTADTLLFHPLNRQPMGFVLVDLQTDARVWRTAQTSTSITLRASAAATCRVLVL